MSIELLEKIKSKTAELKKTIVLPESHDERVLKAAGTLTKEKIVAVITLGNEDRIRNDRSEERRVGKECRSRW